eukprot:7637380-Ditylum_brightwellii.AAC.1
MQAVAFFSNPDMSQSMKGKLYRMNNTSKTEKEKWLHTGHWMFVPFTAMGQITDHHIASMFRAQNLYLCDTIGISVKGFKSIDSLVTAPGFQAKISFHCWLLTIKTSDGTMQLFTLVDVDPNDVYYFCTSKANRKEALTWIDALPEFLCQQFSFDDQCLICGSEDHTQGPMRVYRDEAAKNTDNAIQGYASVISEMNTADDDANEIEAVEEDSLANCWATPPCSVYPCCSKVMASSSTKMHSSSESTFWEKASERMDEWDEAAKDREHKCKESEQEISRALDKLTKATNKATKESSI